MIICVRGQLGMAAERKVIDIEDVTDFVKLVDDVRRSHEAQIIRREGREVAIIEPLVARRPRRVITEQDMEEVRALAGTWRGHLDGDEFLKEVYEARNIDTRPEINL